MTDFSRYVTDIDDDERIGLYCMAHETSVHVGAFFRSPGGSTLDLLIAAADEHEAKHHAMADPHGDALVHMWARDENDNPTGHALCDTGDGAYTSVPGNIANSTWQVNCPKCEQIRDEGGA